MPTLSTCYTVESSTIVQTGNLSDLGVSSPNYVSREYLDNALKAVENRWSEKFDKVENESLLLAKLLIEALDNQQDADLFSLLHSHHQQQQQLPISVQPTDIGRALESNFSDADTRRELSASGRQLVVVEDVVPISTVSGKERSSNQGKGTSTSQEEGESRSLVVYLANDESRVEKPTTATCEEVMEAMGISACNFIDIDELDTDEQDEAKYYMFWKVKEEGEKEIYFGLQCASLPENSVNDKEFGKNASEAEVPRSVLNESIFHDIFGEDFGTDDQEDEPVQTTEPVQVNVAAQEDALYIPTAIPIVSPGRNCVFPITSEASDANTPNFALPLPKFVERVVRTNVSNPIAPIVIEMEKLRRSLSKEGRRMEREEKRRKREARDREEKEKAEKEKADAEGLPYIRNLTFQNF
ncbi:hypothetical protein L6452_18091 [Arctium lappa]|uniref:Uncharacterized protein n=1 Tax=Arctium lappa TaxID=4217 RepID=A0ACB9C5C7_ARCLA|nr:hypothetical protein L6452_18091 [Arctium lappa]